MIPGGFTLIHPISALVSTESKGVKGIFTLPIFFIMYRGWETLFDNKGDSLLRHKVVEGIDGECLY
jgi:hypothetical protein